MQGFGKGLYEAVCGLNQQLMHAPASPKPSIHGSRINGSNTVISGDLLANFCFLSPCSAGLKALVPKGEILPLGDTTLIPLSCKLRPSPGHFGLLIPPNREAKKGITVLA